MKIQSQPTAPNMNFRTITNCVTYNMHIYNMSTTKYPISTKLIANPFANYMLITIITLFSNQTISTGTAILYRVK